MPSPSPTRLTWFVVLTLTAAGCSTYRDDLGRAHRHYEEHRYLQALAVLRVLGDDVGALTAGERVRFAYLRGMTGYRLSEQVSGPDLPARPALRSCARLYLTRATTSPDTRAELNAEEITRAKASREALSDAEPGCP